MLYTNIQSQSFLGSGEEDFHLNILAIPFRQKAHVKSGENYISSFREENI